MIEFNIDPVPKPRMVRSDTWAHRPCVDAYWAFKDKLVLFANKANFELPDSFYIEFLIKVPDSWSEKKKKTNTGMPHKQRPDLSNLVKSVEDCLRKEDSSIYHIECRKTWWHEGKIIIYDI